MRCQCCGNEVETVMCAACQTSAEETGSHEPLTNAEVNRANDRKDFKFNALAQYLAIALLLLGIFAVYQTNRVGFLDDLTTRQSNSIEEFQTEVSDLLSKIDALETDCENLRSMNTNLRDSTNRSLRQLRATEETLDEYRSKSDFMDNYIALVTETGEKYHRYNCQYVRDRTFWAYNITAAKGRGYEPCSVCYDE